MIEVAYHELMTDLYHIFVLCLCPPHCLNTNDLEHTVLLCKEVLHSIYSLGGPPRIEVHKHFAKMIRRDPSKPVSEIAKTASIQIEFVQEA